MKLKLRFFYDCDGNCVGKVDGPKGYQCGQIFTTAMGLAERYTWMSTLNWVEGKSLRPDYEEQCDYHLKLRSRILKIIKKAGMK